ncbi:MAG: hypothetical protein FWD05_00970 [Oscillospiraceae bacterium]|nr:hypothetical protein [Oscillospiraceae bacterium]
MGTWSSSLYGNDTTCDVRDTYTEYLLEQLSNDEAFEKTMMDFEELIGDDDEPLFWYALAETQWKVGRLTSEVKEKAFEWIEKDGGVSLWEDSGASSAGWKKTLSKLKEKLESPMRREKKMEVVNQNLWNIGDVYAYQFNTEESKATGKYGKYVLIQKMGEGIKDEYYKWKTPEELAKEPVRMSIHVFNKLFDEMPTAADIMDARLLPAQINNLGEAIFMSSFMDLEKKVHYPAKNLSYLGNMPVPANNSPPFFYIFWRDIEKSLNYRFSSFQDREYEEFEDGVFRWKQL